MIIYNKYEKISHLSNQIEWEEFKQRKYEIVQGRLFHIYSARKFIFIYNWFSHIVFCYVQIINQRTSDESSLDYILEHIID